jgi:hypothetical protein
MDVLSTLLSGLERPSYGQLVAWTCEDYPEQVIAAIPAADPAARIPRGRRLVAETAPIALRGDPSELARIDEMALQAGTTRTAVAIAALRVALERAGG